jgi:hypothetical protein
VALSIALAAIAAAVSHANGRREHGGPPEPGLAAEPPSSGVTTLPGTPSSPVALPPAPAPSESAEAPPGRRAAAAPTGSAPPAHRRTGPGGIYIPPPKDWFK